MSKESHHPANIWTRLALTYAGSIVAESLTYPLDITKTRLQLQGQGHLHASERLGAMRMALQIASKEGVLALFAGLSPALLRHAVYSPIRIVGYEQMRQSFAGPGGDVTQLHIWQRGLAGAASGVVGQFIASPTDLIKVRMQASGRGQGPKYNGIMDAGRQIVQQHGIKGLWKGWGPNVQRAALVNLGELATYDSAKQGLLRSGHFNDNIWCHATASGISGLVSALVSSPADLVKSRLMAHGHDHMYKGTIDCLTKTVKMEGLLSLWKGFLPSWTRLAPWQLTFWLCYEEFRKLVGMDSF